MKNARTLLMASLLLAAVSACAQLDSMALSPRDTLPKDTLFLENGDYVLLPMDMGTAAKFEAMTGMTWIEIPSQYLIQTGVDTTSSLNWMIEYDNGMGWYRVSTVAEVGPELIQYLAQYPGLEWVEKTKRYTVIVTVGKMWSDRGFEIIHNALTEFYNQ